MAKTPISKKEQRRRRKKRNRILKKVLIIVGIIFVVAMLGLAAYAAHAYMATRLPAGTIINGVEVGNCTPKTAITRLAKDMNHIKVQSDDAEAEIDACYTYDEAPLKELVKKAAFSSKMKEKLQSGKVVVNFKITGGYKKTQDVLREAKLSPEDKRAHDAYVDLKNMVIVEEEYGNELNYEKIAKDLAKYIQDNMDKKQADKKYKFSTKESSIQPLVKSDNKSLNDELLFDKEYIAGGLTVKYDDGSVVTMPIEELAKIIKYSKSGPKYYQSGAMEVAGKYAKYKPAKYTVTIEGKDYSLPNNSLVVLLDEEKVAEALYQAAAGKHDAELTMDLRKRARGFSNILVIEKDKATMVSYSGTRNNLSYKCSTKDLGVGIYKMLEEQDDLEKGIIHIDGGGSIKVDEDMSYVYNSLLDYETREGYIAILE